MDFCVIIRVLRVSCCDRPLFVVRQLVYLNIFSSETAYWILTKLHKNDPWVVPYQIVSVGCISTCRSQGPKKGFQNAIFKNIL